MLWTFWLAEQLSASQEVIYSMELDIDRLRFYQCFVSFCWVSWFFITVNNADTTTWSRVLSIHLVLLSSHLLLCRQSDHFTRRFPITILYTFLVFPSQVRVKLIVLSHCCLDIRLERSEQTSVRGTSIEARSTLVYLPNIGHVPKHCVALHGSDDVLGRDAV
jgi:hypothetical protein